MSKNRIKPGTVVYDPVDMVKKTVRQQTAHGLECDWFDKKQQLHRGTVSDSCLESVLVLAER